MGRGAQESLAREGAQRVRAQPVGLDRSNTRRCSMGCEVTAPTVLGIDPGTLESGYAVYMPGGGVLASGVLVNEDMIAVVKASDADLLAIEKIVSYGNVVGNETFDTCEWIGRFQQVWPTPNEVVKVKRIDVKKVVCGNGRAKDPQVRAALLALIGPQGTKAKPGPTYGVKSHAWSALAVAVTAARMFG